MLLMSPDVVSVHFDGTFVQVTFILQVSNKFKFTLI